MGNNVFFRRIKKLYGLKKTTLIPLTTMKYYYYRHKTRPMTFYNKFH